jgi:putative phosphoribosyl transferase
LHSAPQGFESHIMEAPLYGRFEDRAQAGRELAEAVAARKPAAPLLVLGLPRGGVPVAFEVARRLSAPLDVLVVRKVGLPGQPELAIGAIAAGGVQVRNEMLQQDLVSKEVFARLVRREMTDLRRREQAYRAGKPPLALRDAHVVLVDDGLATGATMLAAIQSARQGGARRVTIAVPVASREAAELVRAAADEVVILLTPPWLGAIGEFYEDFRQLQDGEVIRLLQEAAR